MYCGPSGQEPPDVPYVVSIEGGDICHRCHARWRAPQLPHPNDIDLTELELWYCFPPPQYLRSHGPHYVYTPYGDRTKKG